MVDRRLPLCRQHSMALGHFCMTCLDMVCSDCFRAHTHSNYLHKILTLEDAKQAFCSQLKQLVNKGCGLRKEILARIEGMHGQEREI